MHYIRLSEIFLLEVVVAAVVVAAVVVVDFVGVFSCIGLLYLLGTQEVHPERNLSRSL